MTGTNYLASVAVIYTELIKLLICMAAQFLECTVASRRPGGRLWIELAQQVGMCCLTFSTVLQCLLHMPQVEFASSTAESTAKDRNLGKSSGMCSKHCNIKLRAFKVFQGVPVSYYQHVMHSLVDASPSSCQPSARLTGTAEQS